MSRTLLGILRLVLQDNMSGPARGAADSLKGVASAARNLKSAADGAALNRLADGIRAVNDRAGSANIRSWGAQFERTMARLKLSANEMAMVRKSWEDLNASFARDRITGALRTARISEWRTGMVGALTGVRSALQSTEHQASRTALALKGLHGGNLGFTPNNVVRGLGVPAAGLGAGYATARGGRAGVIAGADASVQTARNYLGGFTDAQDQIMRNAAQLQSERFRSVPETVLRDPLREIAQVLGGGDGGAKQAADLSEPVARALTVLQSLKGADRAQDELAGFMRALDTLGRTNPAEIKELLGGFVRAAGVQGRELNLRDLFTTAKRAKSAGAVLSNEFIMQTLPSLMADLGADRTGTALGSMVAQTLAGRATKESKAEQTRLGLRDEAGNFRHGDELKNPFEYTLNRLIPALERAKVDPRDGVAVAEQMGKLFSNQVVADLFTKMVTQADQYQRQRRQFGAAPGLEAADKLPVIDQRVAFQELVAQLQNTGAAISEPILNTINPSLRSLGETFAGLAKAIRENPEISGQLGTVALGAASTAAAGLGVLALRNMLMGGASAVALKASATALTGSAAALTAAAARLGVGGGIQAATGAATGAGAAGAAAAGSRLPMIAALGVGGAALGAGAALIYGGKVIGDGNRALHEGRDPTEPHNEGRTRRRAVNQTMLDERITLRDAVAELDRETARARAFTRIGDVPAPPTARDIVVPPQVLDARRAREAGALPPTPRDLVSFPTEPSRLLNPRQPGEVFVRSRQSREELNERDRESDRAKAFGNIAPGPVATPQVDTSQAASQIEGLKAVAAEAGEAVKSSLNVTAKPNIDLSDVQALNRELAESEARIQRLGGLISGARANLNNSFSDFGVSP